MQTEVWLTIDEVCSLSGEIKETVRRKCKREEYVSKFIKQGKYKIYYILLSSLPKEYQDIYSNADKNKNIENIAQSNNEYAAAPAWARKQADKYSEVIISTLNMNYKEISEFLIRWNILHPEKSMSYTAYYRARKRYEENGIAGLLSKKGKKSADYSIKKEYLDYYKSLYLKEGAPSANSCWRATLGYAIENDNITPLEFPSSRTFDRYIKKELPEQAIYLARYGQAAWNKKICNVHPKRLYKN